MRILNRDQNHIISENATLKKNFFGRFCGLMFSKKTDIILVAKNESITESTIHMMHMFFPIDVIWADSNLKIVDIKYDVQPVSLFKPNTWRIYKPCQDSKYIIELGVGKVGGATIGDQLSLE